MICKAKAIWHGAGRDGSGNLSTDSGVLAGTPYSFKTRDDVAVCTENLISSHPVRESANLAQ